MSSGVLTNYDRSKQYEFSFISKLTVDMSTCMGREENMVCTLHLVNEGKEAQSTTSVCGEQ